MQMQRCVPHHSHGPKVCMSKLNSFTCTQNPGRSDETLKTFQTDSQEIHFCWVTAAVVTFNIVCHFSGFAQIFNQCKSGQNFLAGPGRSEEVNWAGLRSRRGQRRALGLLHEA